MSLTLKILALIACIAAIGAYYYYTPCPISPVVFEFSPLQPSSFEEQEAPIYNIQNVHVFQKQETYAPESYAVDAHGNLYTSMRDGSIQRLFNFSEATQSYSSEVLVRTGILRTPLEKLPSLEKCREGEHMQQVCGTPLGIRINARNPSTKLLICDAYNGLLEFDLETRKLSVLVNQYKGVPFKFTNSVVQAKGSGIIYFTDSSTKFFLKDYADDLMEATANGRLFSYNPDTKETTLLAENLVFANGVALSHDETELYVAESTRARIRTYHIANGTLSTLIEHLPCLPDNLKSAVHSRQKIWVGCSSTASVFVKFMLKNVAFRKFLTKTPKYKSLFAKLRPVVAATLSVNVKTRQVSEVLVDPKKQFHSVAEAFEHPIEKGMIYIGTFHNNAIARFKIPERVLKESAAEQE